MKHIYSLIFLFLVSSSKLFCCDCSPATTFEIRESSFNNADLVFLGAYLGEDSELKASKFSVIELFKGETKEAEVIIKRNSSCSKESYSNGVWLIYGNYQSDSSIDVSMCSATRGFEQPGIAPPLYFKLKQPLVDSLGRELSILKNETQGLASLMSDITLYRNRKQELLAPSHDNFNWNWLLGLSLLTNTILLVILIKKRNTSR